MSPDPALAPSPGRIKRQVQAREHRFALVCPPGFEAVCLDEARALGLKLLPLPGAAAVEAGPILEWTGRLEDLYRACLFLRVASRVLVRLDGFRAGAREELFRHTEAFPWELWLPSGCELKVAAHVRHSRISHEGMAADTVREAINRRLSSAGVAPAASPTGSSFNPDDLDEEAVPAPPSGAPPVQRLIVHIEDNRVQLSLDASGEHLHRRGWRTTHGAAPIRENLAAGLLLWAGWPSMPRLVDGMCGSGTFGIEAAGLAAGLPASGAVQRDYAFCHWPSWSEGPLRWWRKQRLAHAEAPVPVSGNDLDPALVAVAGANAASALGSGLATAWTAGDFFELKPEGRGLLVLNPPYGLRLSDGAGSLYPRLFRHLARDWPDWAIMVLGLPETAMGPMAKRLVRQCRFRHGGLAICAWLFGPL